MDARDVEATTKDDRVERLTRAVAYAIVPFLVVAFLVLYPAPSDTGRLFAWRITPTVTAMVLGSAYLGGAYFFVRVVRAHAWHTVKAGFLPVGLFASLMGIATVLHWSRFNHARPAFWLWVLLYFTTPVLIFLVWFRNRRHDPPPADGEPLLARFAAWAIGVVGALAVGMAGFLFLAPGVAAAWWPWSLTPLTARVLGAIFCLGSAGLGALIERRWSSARIPFQVAAVMLVLFLIAAIRGYAQFDPARPLTWMFLAGFVSVTIALAVTYRGMERPR